MKIYFIISLALILTQLCARHLLMIETITRHGVRYPQFPNAYDHSNITLLDNALK